MFDKKKKRYNEKLHQEFLPEALEIIEKPPSPVGYFMLWITIAIIVCFLLWSILGRIDEAANARGKVITVDGIQTIQSVNEGVITKIYVKEGDRVKEGDKIIALDAKMEKADLNYSKEHQHLLDLKIKLLKEVVEGKDVRGYVKHASDKEEIDMIHYVISLQEGKESSLKKYETEVLVQKKQIDIELENLELLVENSKYLNSRKIAIKKEYESDGVEESKYQLLLEKIRDLEDEEKTYRELLESDAITKMEWKKKKDELELAKSEVKVQKKMVEDSKSQVEDKLSQVENQISENKSMIGIQKDKVNIAKDNLELLKETLVNEEKKSNEAILDLIVQANRERNENEVTVGVKKERYQNQIVVAPYAGKIKTIAVNTIGGVVSSAQPIVEIVPDNSQLIVEANLLNKDIGFVQVNQEAVIKLDTYNFQKYGKLTGTVIYISPDAVEDEKTGLVYKVKIKVDEESFKNTHPELDITTGMEATVEVQTGSRRIIEFFLEPLVKNLDESLKVR